MNGSTRLLAPLAALFALALTLSGCGGQSDDLKVYFGYADNLSEAHQPDPGTFPKPWEGDSGVTFVGTGPKFDAGAIRIVNPTGDAVTVQSLSVDIGSKHYDLWGSNLKVPAHGSLVLTQTELGTQTPPEPNFDSSEVTAAPGTSTPAIPVLHATIGGHRQDVRDQSRILTTGGQDVGAQEGQRNESHAWVSAGTLSLESGGGFSLGWAPVAGMLIALLTFLPALIAGILLLLLAWFLARWAARLVALLLARLGVDTLAERWGLVPATLHGPAHTAGAERRHPHRGSAAWLIGVIVGVFVFLVLATAAASALHLQEVADLATQFAAFIPNLLVALLLLGLGLFLSRWLAGVATAIARDAGLPDRMLGTLVRVLVLFVFAVAAAEQVGIATTLIDSLFTALCAALALAVGLAFGLGGQRTAREIVGRIAGRRTDLS